MAYVPTPTEQATGDLILHLCRYVQMRTAGRISSAIIVNNVLRFMADGGTERVMEHIAQVKRGRHTSLMKRHR